MKIVMLTNAHYPDKLGGLERYVYELSTELVRRGHAVTVVAKATIDAPRTEEREGVVLYRYPVPDKSDPLFALKYPGAVIAGVRTGLRLFGQGAVLHCHFPLPAVLPAMERKRFVYTLHAPVFRELLAERQGSYKLPKVVRRLAVNGLRRTEAWTLRRAAGLIVLSSFMRSEANALRGDSSTAPLEVVAGGVDTVRFTPGTSDPSVPRAVGGPVLFTARRLTPRTGVRELVEAMPEILSELPEARLYVAGSGGQDANIRRRIEELDLTTSVSLLGRIDDDALVSWYRGADIVVTPTQELEGFGLATAEALAAGTPCMVTPVGANPEVAGLVSPRLICSGPSPRDLARGVVELWQDPLGLAQIRAAARAAVHPAMSWPVIAERHVAFYRQVLLHHEAT